MFGASSRFNLRGLRDRRELVAVGKDIGAELKSDDVASLAAAVSFKIVLALFPALLAAVAIFALQFTPADIQDLVTGLLENLPANITTLVTERLDEFIMQAASGGVAVAGIAAGLWAASGAAATLDRALTRAYDEIEERKLVAARGTALAVMIALLLALVAISVLLVAGGPIEERIIASLPLTDTAADTVGALSTIGRYLVAILLLMVLFAFIYWIGPDYEERPSYAWITPGAALAVVTWLVASAAFGWYVATFGSYTDSDSIYGPLGSAIVFMLWLQLSMFALLLGAEVNHVLIVRAREKAPEQTDSAGSVGEAEAERSADDARDRAAARGPDRVPTRRPEPTGTGDSAANGRGGSRTETAGGAIAVHSHGGDAGSPGARPTARPRGDAATGGTDTDTDSGGGDSDRDVPTATLVGAGVAVLSSLAGLVGLLRRLRG